ncbi:hypothetical protein EYF80_050009 [Liparis tanakae]|uniref:Uncharacterized protein n=1 Tax=Liparis tanakae TaxID=230148 RepID=A0A4Z2FF95_9TELE|nr:hypothetical protein EYF80_050009 [Liparis tanakae]
MPPPNELQSGPISQGDGTTEGCCCPVHSGTILCSNAGTSVCFSYLSRPPSTTKKCVWEEL